MASLPIIGFWTGEPHVRPTRRRLYTDIDENAEGKVAIKSVEGGNSEGSLTIFNPSLRSHPELIDSDGIHFLEDGRMLYGRANPLGDGTYDITSYKPKVVAKGVRIKHSCMPEKIIL